MASQGLSYKFVQVDGCMHFVNLLGCQSNRRAFGDKRIVTEGGRKFHNLNPTKGDLPSQWSAHGFRGRGGAIEFQSSNGFDR